MAAGRSNSPRTTLGLLRFDRLRVAEAVKRLMPGTRRSRAGIAENYEERFQTAWPPVAGRLGRVLSAKGTARQDVDDALQTAAERALRRQVPFDGPDDLYAWASTVAQRALIDAYRQQRRMTGQTPDEGPAPGDLERQVRCRLAIEALVPAVRELKPEERAALSVSSGCEPGSREARAQAVHRFRARAKLAAIVEGLVAWLILLLRGRSIRRIAPGLAMTAALGVSGLLLVRQGHPGGAAEAFVTQPRPQSAFFTRSGWPAQVPPGRQRRPTAWPAPRTTLRTPTRSESRILLITPVDHGGLDLRKATAADGTHLLCHADPLIGHRCIDWPAPPVAPPRLGAIDRLAPPPPYRSGLLSDRQ